MPSSRLLLAPAAVIPIMMALACAGDPESKPEASSASTIVLDAPFDDLGWPPEEPWDSGFMEPRPGTPARPNVWVTYDQLPEETPETAMKAWTEAAKEAGWRVKKESASLGKLRTTLTKPGARVVLETRRNGRWLIVDLQRKELELVLSSWPTDPFCPDGTRPRPAALESSWDTERRCYLIDTELLEHGPFEERRDGEVVKSGQYSHGEKVGTWTTRVLQSDPEEVFELTEEFGADGAVRTYRQNGQDVARFEVNEDGVGEGTWTWWSDNGDVMREVEMRRGQPVGLSLDLPGPSTRIPWEEETELEILDADVERGLVAYKIWPYADSDMDSPVNCGYAGMADRPDRGVELGLVHLATGEVESWEVYRSALDKSECMTHDESAHALTAAKERLAELGLTSDRRPALTLPTEVAPRSVRLDVAGRVVSMNARNSHGEAAIRDVFGQVFDSSDYSGYVLATWRIDGDDQPPIGFSYSRSMGGGGDITLVGALESEDQALLLLRADMEPVRSKWGFIRVAQK